MRADPVSRVTQASNLPPPHISWSRPCPSGGDEESSDETTGIQDGLDELEIGCMSIVKGKFDRSAGLPALLGDEVEMSFKYSGFQGIGEFAWKGFDLVV